MRLPLQQQGKIPFSTSLFLRVKLTNDFLQKGWLSLASHFRQILSSQYKKQSLIAI